MSIALDSKAKRQAAEASPGECVVLKFGSSVLRDIGDLHVAVGEIYRYARRGVKVVAVVSAFAGVTDRLIAEAAALGAEEGSRHAPRLIALGEEKAAALLALSCENVGLDARIAGARQIDLRAGGPVDDAHPKSADAEALAHEIARHDVVIVPGFVALGETGEPVLLGRGGTDLTAVFLAEILGLEEVTLVKDVPGVFDKDPAKAGAEARLYDELSWQEAQSVAGKLVQPKAIVFAAERQVAIRVAAAGAKDGTRVAAVSKPPRTSPPPEKLAVAIAGLGVVGGGAATLLASDSVNYRLVGALVRDPSKSRAGIDRNVHVTDDIGGFLETSPRVVIDALPDSETSRALIERALVSGVSVVSANKQALIGCLSRFHEIAAENNASLKYAAGVGGSAPMIETVWRARAEGTPQRISAVLNGTVNYILSALARGVAFADAVRRAQEAGYAEPDPTVDLSGDDARAKLSILSYEAFGEEIDLGAVACDALTAEQAETITHVGGRWKQIASLEKLASGKLEASVYFAQVDDHAFFRSVEGAGNALQIVNDDGRNFHCKGKGAGSMPTALSLIADLGDLRRSLA